MMHLDPFGVPFALSSGAPFPTDHAAIVPEFTPPYDVGDTTFAESSHLRNATLPRMTQQVFARQYLETQLAGDSVVSALVHYSDGDYLLTLDAEGGWVEVGA